MIYLIITASIISQYDADYAQRAQSYVDCIQQAIDVISGRAKIVVVENNGLRPTVLDGLKCDVFYTDSNSIRYAHKGVNELIDIHHVINKYDIQDEDMIIKLTGRYFMLDSVILDEVISKPDSDAFIKFFNVATCQYMARDCVLGLFAIRCKYLRRFHYDTSLYLSPEVEFATYVRNVIPSDKIEHVNDLQLICHFAGDLRKQWV